MSIRTTETGEVSAEGPDPDRAEPAVEHVIPVERPTERLVEHAEPPSDDVSIVAPAPVGDEADAALGQDAPVENLTDAPPGTSVDAPVAPEPAPAPETAPVPEPPPFPEPAPVQDLVPSVPPPPPAVQRSAGAVEPTPIDSPASLDSVHDAVAVETAAGGAGSGAGAGSGTTAGKGRGRRPKKDPEGRMALREHLTELRKRVVRAGVTVLLGAIGGWFLYPPFINYITEPLQALRASDGTKLVAINFSNVAASFDLQLKGAVWIGVIISSPFWIYQLWAFITPGLTKKERRYAVGFVAAAVPLFLAGVYLASLFVPRAVAFFTSFTPDGGANVIDAPTYIGFVLRTVLTFGLSFLLPVVLVALNFAGLLSGRAVLKAWRWVLVASLTFAAVATPTPDVTAMFTLAAPIIVLFALAIVVCLLHDKRKAKREPSYAGLDDDAASQLGDDEASPL